MNIADFLMKYRTPLFNAEGGDGGGGASAGGDAAPAAGDTALGGDASAGDKPTDAPADGAAPAGDAPKDDDKGKDDAGDGSDAPAEFKLTVPEGMEDFQGEFDTFSSEATEWMQANPKATPAEALKWAAERQAEAVTKQTQDMSEAFTKQIDTWESEAKADPDIGGDKYDENVAIAKTAIDAFGSDELKTVLNESGLGNHPAMIKFANKAGQALKDSPVHKQPGGEAKKSLADSLYGKKS